MNKNQVYGRIKEAEGMAKEIDGKVSGKGSLELEGRLQKAAGRVQAGYGDFRERIEKGR